MSATETLTIIVTVAVSLAAGAATVPIVTFLTWVFALRKEGETISGVWRMLGIKFVVATMLIMSAIIMPSAYRLTRAFWATDGGRRKNEPKPCECPCDACKECERRHAEDAVR